MKRIIIPRPGSFRSRQTLANKRASSCGVAVVRGDPALNNPSIRGPVWKPVLIRERNILVGAGTGLTGSADENSLRTNVPKRIGERVGMSELPAMFERTIGSSRRPIGITAMPKRQ
jgi:hypothetical protein